MMDSNHSNKKLKKPWTCKAGCPETPTPCSHLEKELAHPDEGNYKRAYFRYVRDPTTNCPTISPEEFEKRVQYIVQKLTDIGTEDWKIELILDKFISNFSYKDIYLKQGFVSENTVRYAIQKILRELKLKGIKLDFDAETQG